ncbi:ectoine dioxygenase-like isoform X2 [Mya arenaria]|uniref:ectoine dioxygenase-like isoform X2 n=1 Tax=Mya arenaria TaxID=6604 RepID=UPI0022E08AC6|nr:ectoine dioxygenase-like isoform X2 [Mya arenaria]
MEVSEQMLDDYKKNGYVKVTQMFNKEEITHIEKAIIDGNIASHGYGAKDGEGGAMNMVLWWHPGNDVTGMVARSSRIVTACEKILGEEVYHYHTKLMMKQPKTGGKFIWHQDYGYWYNFGFLFPNMMTVFIAVDPCKKENGCLQVLKGSHLCGRINHKKQGYQVGADLDRIEVIEKCCPKEYVEMDPGDVLFFDCNLLHCSSENLSAERRWAFLCAYSSVTNAPLTNHKPSLYTPLDTVPDSAILDCKQFQPNDEEKLFYNPETDVLDDLPFKQNTEGGKE